MGNSCARSEADDKNTIEKLTVGQDYHEFLDKIAGSGVKATASWQATITRAQLNLKREEFWRTRNSGNRRMWLAIKVAVEADSATSLTIIQNNGLKMTKGSITLLEDSEGNIYSIPIFVVNNPVGFYKEKKHKSREVKTIEEVIKIKIRRSGKEEDEEIEVLNIAKVADLKKLYCDKAKFQPDRVKMFFGGKEIKDHDTLAKNFIENQMVVQAFIKSFE